MPEEKKGFDQFKYQNEYKRKNYDRIEMVVPKGEKAAIKEMAASVGQSLNEFLYLAVKERMASISQEKEAQSE